MPMIPQTLNINNLRATNEKSLKLYTIRKITEYSFKGSFKGSVYCYRFQDIAVRR